MNWSCPRYCPRREIDHVQVAIPPGGEERARDFWVGLVGMTELDKPEELEARGGCWFRLGEAEVHCGIEEPFAPARKAHPAVEVEDLAAMAARLAAAGLDPDPDDLYPGRVRYYVDDPFGNRIELISRG